MRRGPDSEMLSTSATPGLRRADITAARTTRYLVVLLGTIATFVGIVELYLREDVIARSDRARRVRAVYESENASVFIGDSTFDLLFPIEGFENLAPPGATILELEVLVRAFYRFRKPERVVLLAAPQLFGSRRLSARNRGSADNYGQHVGLPFALYAFEPGVSRQLKKYGTDLPRWLAGTLPPHEPVAYDALFWGERTARNRTKHRALRIKTQIPVQGFHKSAHYRSYRRLLEFLATAGAEVCLLQNPTTPLYRRDLDSRRTTQRANAAFAKWAREFGFQRVDGNSIRAGLSLNDYINGDHLNEAGAKKFVPAALAACFPSRVGVSEGA